MVYFQEAEGLFNDGADDAATACGVESDEVVAGEEGIGECGFLVGDFHGAELFV